MARNGDWTDMQEVKNIMEKFLDRFPRMFEGVNTDEMNFILTKKKKSQEPIKVHAKGYPSYIFGKPYIVETFDVWWREMDLKKRNLAVWRALCAFPVGAFDEQSKNYGKRLLPEIKMYTLEYAACGGVPNWIENPAAKDPMERTVAEVTGDVPDADVIPGKAIERTPVTKGDVENVGIDD